MGNSKRQNTRKTKLGLNRSGSTLSPQKKGNSIEFSQASRPTTAGDSREMHKIQDQYIKEATPIGSIPIPTSLKGLLRTGGQKLMGNRPEVLIDKLAERLAFERTGVRLYDLLLSKCETLNFRGTHEVPFEMLQQFRQEEMEHFTLLQESINSIGADPTVVTPSADMIGVASLGFLQTISDPRSSISHSFQSILVLELADNDGWEGLIQVSQRFGMDDLASRFSIASNQEKNHLAKIRILVDQLQEAEISSISEAA